MKATRTHALYRFYGDDGALLYVGITNNPSTRFTDHAKDKLWWHEVRGISLEPYDDRASVEAAERRAIAVENPRYNKVRPALSKASRPQAVNSVRLVWACDACHQPIADGQGYLHVSHSEVYVVERFWAEREQSSGSWGALYFTRGDLSEIPGPARWYAHHAACDPDPESADYHFDVARARTHAHLLSWTAHFLESKEWITYTDWDAVIRRMAGVDA